MSVEEAFNCRKSVRVYQSMPLTIKQVAQMLWAGMGRTTLGGKRTTPSAGGTRPLEAYLVAGTVVGIEPGVYRYVPDRHELLPVTAYDARDDLWVAALRQEAVKHAPACIVITADYARSAKRYRRHGQRFALMEAGHVGQNIMLQAAALGLGTVGIGGLKRDLVQAVLGGILDDPLYLFPVGVRT